MISGYENIGQDNKINGALKCCIAVERAGASSAVLSFCSRGD